MSTGPTRDDLTVFLPVWGERYWARVPRALAALGRERVAWAQCVMVSNGAPLEPHWTRIQQACPGIRLLRVEARRIGEVRSAVLQHLATQPHTALTMFADADDETMPGLIDAALDAYRRHPDTVVAFGAVMSPEGPPYPWPSVWSQSLPSGWLRTLQQWAWNNIPLTNGTVLRTRALLHVGHYPALDLAEDFPVACLLTRLGRVVALRRPGVRYHVDPQGLCQRGHDTATWRAAYAGARTYLATHDALSWPWRLLARGYAPIHTLAAWWLARRAVHTTR